MRIYQRSKWFTLAVLIISAFSFAGHRWLLDQSTVFPDNAVEVSICFGDANNDGSIDMVIGKHQDHGTGRTAAFQQTPTGWDAGTQIFSGGNGNVQPLVGHINGSNRLVINKHDQNSYSGNLQFLKFDSDFSLISSYSVSLNNPYFSDQVLVGETVFLNNRYNLAKAEWNGLSSSFIATQLANNGDSHTNFSTIAAEDLTGDGMQEIIYWTYDGARGLNVLTNDNTQVQISHGYALMFTTGQFEPSTSAHEILYANNGTDSLTLVRYHAGTGTFVSEVVLTEQEEVIYTVAAFDTNGDGTDEALLATRYGEILEFDLISGQLKTVLTSDVCWYDSVVADWGEGPRAAFVGSENGDVSVVAFGRDTAVIDDIAGNAYLQGDAVNVQWTFNAPATVLDVQVRDISGETWTTMATTSSVAGSCQLTGLLEGAYDLRLADAADNHIVYGQTATFYVYACDKVLVGDFDGNCYVNLKDFAVLAAGDSRLSDLALLAADWLRCGNPYDETCDETQPFE